MPRSDFATSAEYHADAAIRAAALLNSHIARIDAALAFMDQRKAAFPVSIRKNLEDALNSHRDKCIWYLDMPDHGGTAALGMMGVNGRGPLIQRTIESVDFHANRAKYAALVGRAAA